jgi:transcriptional regulator with XRE-family HTH domain
LEGWTVRVEEVVGRRIRDAREARGISQAEFGKSLGALLDRTWTRQAVSDAEKGKRAFTAQELVALSIVIGCEITDLFRLPADADSLEMPGNILSRDQLDRKLSDASDAAELRRTLLDLLRSAGQLSEAGEGLRQTALRAWDELERLTGAPETAPAS